MPSDPVIYSSNLVPGITLTNPTLVNPVVRSQSPITLTAAKTLTQAEHAGRLIVFNAAAGFTVTLPAATGTGDVYRFVVGTTVTSVADIVAVADATDAYFGVAYVAQDGGNTVQAFEAGADADHISLNGTTTGGIKGDYVQVTDIATNTWQALVFSQATGTEATPFLTGQVS